MEKRTGLGISVKRKIDRPKGLWQFDNETYLPKLAAEHVDHDSIRSLVGIRFDCLNLSPGFVLFSLLFTDSSLFPLEREYLGP